MKLALKKTLEKSEEPKPEVKLPTVDTTADFENEQLILANAFNFQLKYDEFLLQVNYSDFIAHNHQVLAWCLIELKAKNIKITDELECFKLILNDCPHKDVSYETLVLYAREIRSAYTTEAVNYSQHVAKLKTDCAKNIIKKQAIANITRLASDPRATMDQVKDALEKAQQVVEKGRLVETHFKDTKELSKIYLEALENRKKGIIVKTCYTPLDNLFTQGFAPGTVSLIAGRPGAGKSAFISNLILRQSMNDIRVALFSLEMNSVNMYDRMLSIRTKIATEKLMKEPALLSELENKVLNNALQEFENLPMLLCDKATISLNDLKRQLTLLDKQNRKPQVVFVDLFGKLKDVNIGENLAPKIEQKLQEIYEFSKDYQTHFCLAVQINRDDSATKKNYKKRPSLKGLKNSGAYEEVADIVMLLHRNKYYDDTLQDDIFEINIAKQRSGRRGQVFLEFDPDICSLVTTDKTPIDFGDATQDQE